MEELYDCCPCLKFAHFTANQAILEAVSAATTVHVIDFGFDQGMQWPPLMQALALRSPGPPAFRLTGIGPPRSDNTDSLFQAGLKLAQLADTIGVEFQFRGFIVDSVADLEPAMLEIRPETEVLAVNSIFEMNRLLDRPGSVDKVLATIKAMNPRIVTVVEEEVVLGRFGDGGRHCSDLVDSEPPPSRDALAQWRNRFTAAGFDPVHLGPNAFRQARMMLELHGGGGGHTAEERGGCMVLWRIATPLIAVSAWRVAGDSQ